MILIALKTLPETLLPAAVELDQSALGGLWAAEGYQQEWSRPSSNLLGVWPLPEQALNVDGLQIPVPSQLSQPTSHLPLFGMGCGWSILDETHIVLLAVHPDFRQRGLGSALLLGLLGCACDRNANYATLEVRASNPRAIALYEKFGFKTAGRRPKYYSDGDTREDAIILWRSGLQSAEFRVQMMQHWQALELRWAAWNWKIASPLQSSSSTE